MLYGFGVGIVDAGGFGTDMLEAGGLMLDAGGFGALTSLSSSAII